MIRMIILMGRMVRMIILTMRMIILIILTHIRMSILIILIILMGYGQVLTRPGLARACYLMIIDMGKTIKNNFKPSKTIKIHEELMINHGKQ